MQAHGLNSVDDLWFAFYGRIEQILKTQGLVPSGWEEIAVRKTRRDGRPAVIVNPGFAERGWRAYVWNNVPGWGAEDLAYRRGRCSDRKSTRLNSSHSPISYAVFCLK